MKLKIIDGGPHKQWSMWFNSIHAKNLTWARNVEEVARNCNVRKDFYIGAAWLSSARAVRCLDKSSNERNPYRYLPARNGGNYSETAEVNSEEGEDDVKSAWPLCPGLHTCYNGRYRGQQNREVKLIPENRSQFRLQSATRLHEVGIASNGASATAP